MLLMQFVSKSSYVTLVLHNLYIADMQPQNFKNVQSHSPKVIPNSHSHIPFKMYKCFLWFYHS